MRAMVASVKWRSRRWRFGRAWIAGNVGGALSDYGINDDVVSTIGDVLQLGQAVLFIMA
jgi:uncharacterized membrane protein